MVNTINKLGQVFIEQGNLSLARACLEESMTISREIGDRWGMIYTLESYASMATAVGDYERTARLWGTAEISRETLGAPLLLNDRLRYEHDLAMARAQLGETAFRDEWAAGRALGLDQAIAYALAPRAR